MADVSLTVNGKAVKRSVPDNTLLSEFLRENLAQELRKERVVRNGAFDRLPVHSE